VPEDWPEKWDLADPVPEGVNPTVLDDLLSSAVPWQRPQGEQDEQLKRQFHSFGPYRMSERGLFYDRGDKDKESTWLSRPFEVLALTRDPNSSGWGLLLRWTDPDGQVHEWAMPSEALGGGRDEIWRSLLRGGLKIAPSTENRGLLAAYLSQVEPEGRACGLSRIGWHSIDNKRVYVLPDETFGNTTGERVIWQTEARNETFFRVGGSLEGWKTEVAQRCIGKFQARARGVVRFHRLVVDDLRRAERRLPLQRREPNGQNDDSLRSRERMRRRQWPPWICP